MSEDVTKPYLVSNPYLDKLRRFTVKVKQYVEENFPNLLCLNATILE